MVRTWQLFLQVLIVFVSVFILCNQGSGFGITYVQQSALALCNSDEDLHTLVLDQESLDQQLFLALNSSRRGTYVHLMSSIL